MKEVRKPLKEGIIFGAWFQGIQSIVTLLSFLWAIMWLRKDIILWTLWWNIDGHLMEDIMQSVIVEWWKK